MQNVKCTAHCRYYSVGIRVSNVILLIPEPILIYLLNAVRHDILSVIIPRKRLFENTRHFLVVHYSVLVDRKIRVVFADTVFLKRKTVVERTIPYTFQITSEIYCLQSIVRTECIFSYIPYISVEIYLGKIRIATKYRRPEHFNTSVYYDSFQ